MNLIRKKCKPLLLLFAGFLAYLLSNGEECIPLLVWIYPTLFLYLLGTYRSRFMCLVLWAAYTAGFMFHFANVLKTGFWLCAGVAVLYSCVKILPYLLWLKAGKGFSSTVVFAAAMTMGEYLVACCYPILGGLSDAYTQVQNLTLLQITTITGIYGITFIINWTAAVIVWVWDRRTLSGSAGRYLLLYLSAMGLVFLYGTLLLQHPSQTGKTVRVAAVTVPISPLLNEDEDVNAVFYTNSFTEQNLINTKEKLSQVAKLLFQKTIQEAEAGAKIVFWSELNGAVMKEDEEALLDQASLTAREQGIYLVLSLLVKTPYENLKENKTVAFSPDGIILSEYYKHGRSIGELCLKGNGRIQSFDSGYGLIAPLICSDMAFTSKIRQTGKSGIDIIIVPASDWKEMTEIANKTAIVRGVENGCNVVRHTNMGSSVATDFRGRVLAAAVYFQSDTLTMSAQVPTSGRFTIYPVIGDLFVYLCLFYLAGMMLYYKKSKTAQAAK